MKTDFCICNSDFTRRGRKTNWLVATNAAACRKSLACSFFVIDKGKPVERPGRKAASRPWGDCQAAETDEEEAFVITTLVAARTTQAAVAPAGAVSQHNHHYFSLGNFRPRGREVASEAEDKMKKLALKVRHFLASEDGPTAVEYAVMLALIVIVCLTAINSVGQNASTTFSNVANSLSTINGS